MTVHEPMFQDAVKRQMGNRVKGYALVVINRKGEMAKASDGWAQAPGDGNLAMKTFIPGNIGSVSKVLSGVALLDLLEARGDIAQQVRMPIRFFTPDRWGQEYLRNNQTASRLTIEHLLRHKTGLTRFSTDTAHRTKIARALAAGAAAPNPDGFADFAYFNENITFLQYMIPAIAYPDEVDRIERDLEHATLGDYNWAVAKRFGALFERYMRERFFPRAGINPTCRLSEVPNGRYAKEYTSRNAPRGTEDNPDFCRAQGSWKLSAQELAKAAHAIEFTDKIIGPETRKFLAIPADDWAEGSNLILWRRIARAEFAKPGAAPFRAHAGGTNEGARAVYVRLPDRHVGLAVATSPELHGVELADVLVRAYYEASRPIPEFHVDRPGGNIRSVKVDKPNPDACRKLCRDETACRGWTYVKPGVQGDKAVCWLKRIANAKVENSCCVSGAKGVAYGRDRPGDDFTDFVPGRADPTVCRDSCDLRPGCKSWAYARPNSQDANGRCWLKRSVPAAVDNVCCDSGRSR